MMQGGDSLKLAFLREFLLGLRRADLISGSMSLSQRKNAIKQSSDVALAAARSGGASWSRAVLAAEDARRRKKAIVNGIQAGGIGGKWSAPAGWGRRRGKSGRSPRRSRVRKKRTTCPASEVARKMLKKRTHFLKRIVPGGDSMDGLRLVDEAIDYILSLRAQVDVMQLVADAVERSNGE